MFRAILYEGEEVALVSNLRLVRGSIHSERIIELRGANPSKFSELRALGLMNEQIDWKQRFFVPTNQTDGIDILAALLDHFPIVADSDTEPESQVFEIALGPTIAAINPIDLDLWIASSDESTSAKAIEELEELGSVDADDSSDSATVLQIDPDATSISWLEQPGVESQLGFNFA